MEKKNTSLAERLQALHLDLEERKSMGADWRLARGLEDRIGSGQDVTTKDLESAEVLLEKYGF